MSEQKQNFSFIIAGDAIYWKKMVMLVNPPFNIIILSFNGIYWKTTKKLGGQSACCNIKYCNMKMLYFVKLIALVLTSVKGGEEVSVLVHKIYL